MLFPDFLFKKSFGNLLFYHKDQKIFRFQHLVCFTNDFITLWFCVRHLWCVQLKTSCYSNCVLIQARGSTHSWTWWADSSCRSRETSGALGAETKSSDLSFRTYSNAYCTKKWKWNPSCAHEIISTPSNFSSSYDKLTGAPCVPLPPFSPATPVGPYKTKLY